MSKRISSLQWAEVRAGFLATIPLWLGSGPFGIIYAVSALAAGLDPAQTLVMSLIVFAGAAQFTAAGMFAAGVAPLTIVITTLIVNARHVLLSASLASHLRGTGFWARLGLASQLTDESYAIGIAQFMQGKGSAAYQFGTNISMYISWQASTIIGILLGSFIPDPAAYGLDLVFPLTFIGLLMPLLRDRVSWAVCLFAAILTIVGALVLPGSWYLLLAGIVASMLGIFQRSQPSASLAPAEQLEQTRS